MVTVAGCNVSLQTAAPGKSERFCDWPVLGGDLVADAHSGLALSIGADVYQVMWPAGYSARRYLVGPVVLVDRQGNDIAREGDRVSMRGSFDQDNVVRPCDDPDLEVVP